MSQIKEIKYTTLSTDATDYTCQDGELATVANMVNEDGSMIPINGMESIFQVPDGTTKVFVHESPSFTGGIKRHYIYLASGGEGVADTLTWQDAEDAVDDTVEAINGGGTSDAWEGKILSITTIGNVLAVNTTVGVQYVIWKNETGSYHYLGKRPTDIVVKAEVTDYQGRVIEGNLVTNDLGIVGLHDEVAVNDSCELSTFEFRNDLCNRIFAGINLAEKSVMESGGFSYPFLIRLAWRLIDGTSLMCHTQPILINPCATARPRIVIAYGSSISTLTITIPSVKVTLDIDTTIGEWKDLVQSLDVFITPQAYGYSEDNDALPFVFKGGGDEDTAEVGAAFAFTKDSGFEDCYELANWTDNTEMIIIPKRIDNRTAADVIANESRFYLIKSIGIEELAENSTIELKPTKFEFDSLSAREVMTDSQDTRKSIVARDMYNYNSRLCLAVDTIVRDIPQIHSCINAVDFTGAQGTVSHIQLEVEVDGRRKLIESDYVQNTCLPTHITWLYTDNTNVKAAWLVVSGTTEKWYKIPLKRHETLNGMYAFNNFESLEFTEITNTSDIPSFATDGFKEESLTNVVYQSEVNNPFFFPVKNNAQIGVGSIMKIRSAIKAMSTSQYGQFPIYVLSTDGTWAIEFASDGTFSKVRLVTPDICLNANTVAQIDSAIIFATARGLMLLSGSSATCISDTLSSSKAFDVTTLDNGDKLVTVAGVDGKVVEYGNFNEFIADCRIAYDYVRQRIIVFNPTKVDGERVYHYAYVYSLKSKSWGIMATDIDSIIETYGDLLAVDDNGNVVTGEGENITGVNGLLITRPIKLGLPDKLKTIRKIVQRGVFDVTHIKSVLYASNDLLNWYLVQSSRTHVLGTFTGSPYKYYRIGIICTLTQEESLYGCTVEYEVKKDDKVR